MHISNFDVDMIDFSKGERIDLAAHTPEEQERLYEIINVVERYKPRTVRISAVITSTTLGRASEFSFFIVPDQNELH